jgi:hypothetical protein
MDAQTGYAKLLQEEGLGDGLFYPSREARIGDVAYFEGPTYKTWFNIFDPTHQVNQLYRLG